ncbi:MAG: ABC transporter permease [Thermoproteota archaeon]|jgi:ABC-2 type transport system permease protein
MSEKQGLYVLNSLLALTNRELKKWYKVPIILFLSLFQPIVWLVLFGKSMNLGSIFTGTSIEIPGLNLPKEIINEIASKVLISRFGTTDYFSYLAAGMISFIILFTSMSSGMTMVWDRRLGFLNKLLATPIPRPIIILSKTTSAVLRALVQATIVILVATLLGMQYKPNLSILDFLSVYLALFLMALGLSSLFIMLAIRASSWESQMAIMNLLNLPLLFSSNAFYPIDIMPSWLQPVAYINPITYTNDIVRQSLLGVQGINPLFIDYLYLLLFASFLATLGIVLSWRYLSK